MAGQSAGAMSAVLHMANPDLDHLYSSVLLFSTPLVNHAKTAIQARKYGELVKKRLFCSNAACLRRRPAWMLLLVQPYTQRRFPPKRWIADLLVWTPVLDNRLVRGQVFDLLKNNQLAPGKQIMMGHTKEESGLIALFVDHHRVLMKIIFEWQPVNLVHRWLRRSFVGHYYERLLSRLLGVTSFEGFSYITFMESMFGEHASSVPLPINCIFFRC